MLSSSVLTYALHIDTKEKYHLSSAKRTTLDRVETLISNTLHHTSYLTSHTDKANILLVGGGDGTFLGAQRTHMHRDIIFYGLNAGRKGYLMNSLDRGIPLEKELIDVFTLPVYEYIITQEGGTTQTGWYLSELVIGSSDDEYFEFSLTTSHPTVQEHVLCGSSLVLNTSQGMTGYAGPLTEPLLGIESKDQRLIGGNIAGFEYLHLGPQYISITEKIKRHSFQVSIDGRQGLRIDNVLHVESRPTSKTITVGYHIHEEYEKRRSAYRKQKNTPLLSTTYLG